MRNRTDEGMVTAELALGLVALLLVVVAAIGCVGVARTQGECWDTASEVARQVARGDKASVERAKKDAPRDAEVRVGRGGDVVTVTVEVPARPFGERGPAVRLEASARVIAEPGVS